MTSAPAERPAPIEEGSHHAMPIAAGNDADAAEGSAQAALSSPDPWLRDRLAALELARLYEPLPQRLQEPLRALQHALRQTPKGRR